MFSLKASAVSLKLAFSYMLTTSFQLTQRINPNTAYHRVLGYSGVFSYAPNVSFKTSSNHCSLFTNYLPFGAHI